MSYTYSPVFDAPIFCSNSSCRKNSSMINGVFFSMMDQGRAQLLTSAACNSNDERKVRCCCDGRTSLTNAGRLSNLDCASAYSKVHIGQCSFFFNVSDACKIKGLVSLNSGRQQSQHATSEGTVHTCVKPYRANFALDTGSLAFSTKMRNSPALSRCSCKE